MATTDAIEFEPLDKDNCTKIQDIIDAINNYMTDLYERVEALEGEE